MRAARHDILFEPVQLGPKTPPNRFWQVPQCNGGGSDRPGMQAGTERSRPRAAGRRLHRILRDHAGGRPFRPSGRIWDKGDVRNLARCATRPRARGRWPASSSCTAADSPATPSAAPPARAHADPERRQPHTPGDDEARHPRAAGAITSTVRHGPRRGIRPDLLSSAGAGTCPSFLLRRSTTGAPTSTGPAREPVASRRAARADPEAVDDCASARASAIDTSGAVRARRPGIRADEEGRRSSSALDHLVDYWDVTSARSTLGRGRRPIAFLRR